jgi:hypothetical protein
MPDLKEFLKSQEGKDKFDYNKFMEIYKSVPEEQQKEFLKSMNSTDSFNIENYKSQIENNLQYKCVIESYKNLYKDIPKEKQIEILLKSIESEDGIKDFFGNIVKNISNCDSENARQLAKQTVDEYRRQRGL